MKRPDTTVGISKPNLVVGGVDRRSIVVEAEPLGDFAGGRVVLGDPSDDRNIGVNCRRCGYRCNSKLRRVTVALVGGRDSVVEVPCAGALALSATDSDDSASVTPAYRPVAEQVGVET